MKRLSFVTFCALVSMILMADGSHAGSKKVGPDCTFKGKRLYGKVKYVSSFPDFKVKVVSSFPDLKVKHVDAFPDSCGKWKVVESFPDFTVQIVDSFPDFTIRHVDAFPGLP